MLFVPGVHDHLVSYANALLVKTHVMEASQEVFNDEFHSLLVKDLESQKQYVVALWMHGHVLNVVLDVLENEVFLIVKSYDFKESLH